MTHRSEGKLFNNPDQSSQASTHNTQDLQRDLGMGQAKQLKILFADEEKCGIVYRSHRGRVVTSIEDGQLCDGTAWPIDAEYLLAATCGTLKDTDVSGLDHIEPRARFTLTEHGLARRKVARHRALGQENEFRFCQPGKDGDSRQRLTMINFNFHHGGYCTGPDLYERGRSINGIENSVERPG